MELFKKSHKKRLSKSGFWGSEKRLFDPPKRLFCFCTKSPDVTRRLKIPHATVRNYYQGRLPAPEVFIKIANETGVSLNWLLIGTGYKYAGLVAPIGIGRFLEEKIEQIIDKKLAATLEQSRPNTVIPYSFADADAVISLDNPHAVINEWFSFENRECPRDYGIVFFRGWEVFSQKEKIGAASDAMKVQDRSLELTNL